MTSGVEGSPLHSDVIMVGAVPPPVGGVTIHCDRAIEALRRYGLRVVLVDLRPARSSPAADGAYRGLRGLLRLGFRRRQGIVFLHFSASRRLGRTLRVLGVALAIDRRDLVLVQHSGGYPAELERRSASGVAHRTLARRAAAALCFSERIETAMLRVAPDLSTVRASSFLPDERLRALATERSGSLGDPVIVTSGYRTSTYRYEEVLDVYEQLLRSWPSLQLHIYGYGATDDEVWESVRNRCATLPGVTVFADEDSETFLRGLARATVYFRNTTHDSYGVAVAEALFLGTPVVATDVCDRPPGARVVDVGDVAKAVDVLGQVLDDAGPERVQSRMDWGSDGIDAYLEISRRMAESHGT